MPYGRKGWGADQTLPWGSEGSAIAEGNQGQAWWQEGSRATAECGCKGRRGRGRNVTGRWKKLN